MIDRYRARISGPLLDRIDLHIPVPAVKYRELVAEGDCEGSAAIRERILTAGERQQQRLAPFGVSCNAQMTPRAVRRFCKLDAECARLLERAMKHVGLSARAYDRILRVARTIADLAASENIEPTHVAEAIQSGRWIAGIRDESQIPLLYSSRNDTVCT
jgi:magnesium chelatase family protein